MLAKGKSGLAFALQQPFYNLLNSHLLGVIELLNLFRNLNSLFVEKLGVELLLYCFSVYAEGLCLLFCYTESIVFIFIKVTSRIRAATIVSAKEVALAFLFIRAIG